MCLESLLSALTVKNPPWPSTSASWRCNHVVLSCSLRSLSNELARFWPRFVEQVDERSGEDCYETAAVVLACVSCLAVVALASAVVLEGAQLAS